MRGKSWRCGGSVQYIRGNLERVQSSGFVGDVSCRQEVLQRKLRVLWRGPMVGGFGGKGCRLLGDDGVEVASGRKHVVWPLICTPKGREQKERSYMKDC